MMNFVLGRAGSGKSTYILNEVKKLALAEKNIYVVVPEQFTFETERKYLGLLGAQSVKSVNVTSFTRIAHNVFKKYGNIAGEYADEGVKLIMMNKALSQVKDELKVYEKAAKNVSFAKDMLSAVSEFKNAGITPESLDEHLKAMPEGLLRQKTNDILKIYYIYDALLTKKYKDNLDDLSRANKIIADNNFFEDSFVFIDEFKGFTANEMSMIKSMALQANDLLISLCLDVGEMHKTSIFESVNKTYLDLKLLAQKNSVKIGVPKKLDGSFRFKSKELEFMQQNTFAKIPKVYKGKCENITVTTSANEYDEAEFAVASICDLVKNKGYRYKDIVIVSRDLEVYEHCLETAFLKYDIPYYMDNPKNIFTNPLIRFVKILIKCACGLYSSWDMLSILKCGVCKFSFEDISLLENYMFMWDIKAKDFTDEFKLSTFGLEKPETDEQKAKNDEALEKMNLMRESLIGAIEKLKLSAKTKNAANIGTALFEAMSDLGTLDAVNEVILKAQNNADMSKLIAVADEYRRVWEIIGETANKISLVLDGEQIEISEYAELFDVVAASFEIETIPQSLDCVTVGSAQRIRTDSPKVLFLLGANDKVFPFVPTHRGLFTDKERSRLTEYDMKLSKPLKERIIEERFIAYKTLTLASEKLYISARSADIKGSALSPSELFMRFEYMFGEDIIKDTFDTDKLFFCRTKKSAFGQLANNFRIDDALSASLREYFLNDEEYSEKIKMLLNAQNPALYKLSNKEDIKKLYGESVYMSPTGVENFYQCKFAYFCQNGLKLRARQKIQINNLNKGLIIHEILSKILSEFDDFTAFDEAKVKASIDVHLKEYLNNNMAGEGAYSKRFLYLYSRLKRVIFEVVKSIFEELKQSLFKPTAFEYKINSHNEIKPLKLKSDDGIPIRLKGTIDRIDVYTAPSGQKYARVIDYKSGSKQFKLSDIINGINLQMFIYLMCIQESGADSYKDTKGAGVLYVPASEVTQRLEREDDKLKSVEEKQKHYKRFGVILDDKDIIKAMEKNLDGQFTPISVKSEAYNNNHNLKDDIFTDNKANERYFTVASMQSLLNAAQLGKLFNKIKRLAIQMVNELYDGQIEAIPLKNGTSVRCNYCEYKNVCRHDEDSPVRKYEAMNKDEIFDLIKEEDNGAEH